MVTAVAFSPDGTSILMVSEYTIRLWDLKGTLLQYLQLEGHIEDVSAITFSPDGKTILTGLWDDQTARLWGLEGNQIGKSMEHNQGIYSIAFAPDGRTIVTGSANHTARLWRVTPLLEFLRSNRIESLSAKQKKEYGID